MADVETPVTSALRTVIDRLDEAIAAPKCHKCGCLQQTVEALVDTEAGKRELLPVLSQARSVFVPKRYDCLGCPVCYPALAANAFAEAFPEAGGSLDLCPTEEPEERRGWPPLPGDYAVLRYGAPVAVCALNSKALVDRLVRSRPEGLAVIGTMHTENLGIERVIQNTLANPNIRFLLLCGADTRQVVGHLPGQSLESLFRNGLDERGRIIGAQGRRPMLKNVSREEVQAFMQQVELVSMIGEESEDTIAGQIREYAERNPGPYPHPFKDAPVERVKAEEPKRLVLDRAGYFVIYPEGRAKRLVVEHFSNQGVLDCVLEGASPAAIYTTAIERQLLTRLDHAAYLGRELARAEKSLIEGTPFAQDAAPGEVAADIPQAACGTDSSCNCSPAPHTKGGADGDQTEAMDESGDCCRSSGRNTARSCPSRAASGQIA